MTKKLIRRLNLVLIAGFVMVIMGLNGCQVSSDNAQNGTEPKQEDITFSANGTGNGVSKALATQYAQMIIGTDRKGNGIKYLCVDENGYVIAKNSLANNISEKFVFIYNNDETVSIRASRNGRYLSYNDSDIIMAKSDQIGPNEKFYWHLTDNNLNLLGAYPNQGISVGVGLDVNNRLCVGKGGTYFKTDWDLTYEVPNISLKCAATGKYVRAVDNLPDYPLYADSTTLSRTDQIFDAVLRGGIWTFRSHASHKFVCSEGGSLIMHANRGNIGAWESFNAVYVGDQIAFKASDGRYVCSEAYYWNYPMWAYGGLNSYSTFIVSQQ
jgi:hypothetical protein